MRLDTDCVRSDDFSEDPRQASIKKNPQKQINTRSCKIIALPQTFKVQGKQQVRDNQEGYNVRM